MLSLCLHATRCCSLNAHVESPSCKDNSDLMTVGDEMDILGTVYDDVCMNTQHTVIRLSEAHTATNTGKKHDIEDKSAQNDLSESSG